MQFNKINSDLVIQFYYQYNGPRRSGQLPQ